jgi:hypothetical protein
MSLFIIIIVIGKGNKSKCGKTRLLCYVVLTVFASDLSRKRDTRRFESCACALQHVGTRIYEAWSIQLRHFHISSEMKQLTNGS